MRESTALMKESSWVPYHGQPGSWQRTVQNELRLNFVDDPAESHQNQTSVVIFEGDAPNTAKFGF
jgi:hypothetical protein